MARHGRCIVKLRVIRRHIGRIALVAAVASFGVALLGIMTSAGSASAQECMSGCVTPVSMVSSTQLTAGKPRPTKAPSKTPTVTESVSLSFTKVEWDY
jgi:hypothetical protein